MSVVRVGELTVHCRELAGSSARDVPPTVVFVHGLGTDSLASFHLTLAEPMARAGVNVLSYDLRGHGRTSSPESGYRLEQFVADLHGLVTERGLLDRRIHLVGNSFGGTIAFAYAARHPALVATVVAIEAEPPTEVWLARMADTMRRIREWFADEANFVRLRERHSPQSVSPGQRPCGSSGRR